MNVDVDRAYVLSIHIIISCFTWFLMQIGVTALVWEAVRHWGSWRERLIVDPEPYAMSEDDRRSRVEFFLPLVFYFVLWMVRKTRKPSHVRTPCRELPLSLTRTLPHLELLHHHPPQLEPAPAPTRTLADPL
jgi:hypothetical protein